MISRVRIHFAPLFSEVRPKQAQMTPTVIRRARTADYQTPVNILSKYDNLVEKSMHLFVPGQKKISQQMLGVAPYHH